MTSVSILIAVYNAERYLRQCLDSVLGQTMADLQVLCVDDASTDNSLAILREYAALDPRVEVFPLETNHGVAYARNVGLRKAKGEFVCFVDSDDWIATDALEEICKVFRAHPLTDCVLFDLYLSRDGVAQPYPMPPFDVMKGSDAFVKSLTWEVHGVYAVRADLHKAYPYETGLKEFGDENTTRIHYLRCREVRMSGAKYFYRLHSQSVTHVVSLRRFDFLLANQHMKQTLLREKVSPDVLRHYEHQMWLNLVGMYGFYFQHRTSFSKEERRQALALLKRSWSLIDTRLLSKRTSMKFGYIPFRGHWRWFRVQEEVYFALRKAVGR